ncbi:MAG: hypothetical protein UT13_C0001G0172 [Candidatus Pacebacteria bacterium GW2011_GWF2_38_9]|nr:MAG: (di)nucleoside polyphosphate hydrolase [candidate division TM6 bacterium GW2011_GWF2_28_16]KKQ09887.1 MAG: hypothetical protein US20_C0004G0026 [Candidatus Pacebacteria bacterium GW2011_GWF1_36_5]KKQ88525.1 MAG: hypothetical protein UT13_C0001G0172 [Candidatus Pacebacteria bacterium GW2011_GWF2_38_9]HAZ73340.1 hypothetical protein [Candidatus Paceibacterota bacterium]
MTPKFCFTASVFLIHNDKVLLIKHKKLNMWLGPGGHIDENELPHLAAEREFFEETGLRVKVYSAYKKLSISSKDDRFFHPLPFAINEHWVCKENYERRLLAEKNKAEFAPETKWPKGCEKHLNFTYLAKLIGPLEINPAEGESQEITWFSLEDLKGKDKKGLMEDIFKELLKAFELAKSSHS